MKYQCKDNYAILYTIDFVRVTSESKSTDRQSGTAGFWKSNYREIALNRKGGLN
jgi:hypothetical protein